MSDDEEDDHFDVGTLPLNFASLSDLAQAPANKDGSSLRIVFAVDMSRSMGTRDIPKDEVQDIPKDNVRPVARRPKKSKPVSRFTAVLQSISQFMLLQKASDAVANDDLYSLVVFNEAARCVINSEKSDKFQKSMEAFMKTVKKEIKPACAANYLVGLRGIQEEPSRERPMRVILLSDGRPTNWNDGAVGDFQDWTERMSEKGSCEVHSIGFGKHLKDFEILQQLAQLGGGGFQLAGLNMDHLRHAFTSVSQSITTTRIRSSGYVVPTEKRSERKVRFGQIYPWQQGARPNRGCETMKCVRMQYAWNSNDATATCDSKIITATTVKRRPKPHAKGNMRFVFAMNDLSLNENMVSKESKYQTSDMHDEVRSFISSTCYASHITALFSKLVQVNISVLPCYLYHTETPLENSPTWFCGEKHLPGIFVKWVGNFGFINRVEDSSVLEALAHFSLHNSEGKLMLSDLQGVYKDGMYSLTDPQLLSHDKRFGRADLGEEGMRKFREQHSCNQYCRRLGIGFGQSSGPQNCSQASNQPLPKPHTLIGDRLASRDLFMSGQTVRKLLFVGECTLSFCLAAAKLINRNASDPPWVASELHFPRDGEAVEDCISNSLALASLGVSVCSMDALAPDWRSAVEISNVESAVWAMPYPAEYVPGHPITSASKATMQRLIFGYVKAVLPTLAPGGSVSVVLLSKQHLDWGLREQVETSVGVAHPEMRLFSLQPLLDNGYRPRFGDSRDKMRQAKYHLLVESVCIQWRVEFTTAGMTDTRLRCRIGR